MAPRVQLKDDYLESRLIRRRLVLSAVFVLVLIVMVVIRLYVLQVSDFEHFTTLSDSNRVRIKALPPTRGLIFDRNGVVMANNLPSYRLEIVHEEVDDIELTLQRLQRYIEFDEQDLRRFKQASSRRRPFESIPLKLNLDDEEVAKLAVNLHELDGVDIYQFNSGFFRSTLDTLGGNGNAALHWAEFDAGWIVVDGSASVGCQ